MGLFNCFKKDFLFPKEILLLNYLDKKNVATHLPNYWAFEYNLDIPNIIKKLLAHQYLQYAPDKFILSKCKVNELKDIIIKNNLKVKGKKDDLIETILQNIPNYQKYLTEKYYLLTDKGLSIIQLNDHLIYWHTYRNIFDFSLDEIDLEKQKYPNCSKYDLALKITDRHQNKNLNSKSYGLYRNNIFIKSEILGHMGEIQEQIKTLLQVCYLDLTIGNYQGAGFSIPPGIIGKLAIALQESNATIDDYENYFNNLIFTCVPKNICYKANYNKVRFEINRLENASISTFSNDKPNCN